MKLNKMSEKSLEELVQMKLDGVTYSEIKEELKQEGLEEGEIKILIQQIDQRVLNQVDHQTHKSWKAEVQIIGFISLFLGLGILLLTMINFYKIKIIFIPIGLIIFGVTSLFYTSRQKKRKGSKAPFNKFKK